MTAAYPSGTNTFIPSHDATQNMIVDFARNLDDFAINKYAEIRKAKQTAGYWLKMTVEEAGRILDTNLAGHEWADGNDAPAFNDGTESFEWLPFATKRRAFGFNIGSRTSDNASWDIIAQHSSIKARQAMTARTQLVVSTMTNASLYASAHTSAVSSITGVSGKWDVSTTARSDIKRSLDHAAETIFKATLGAVKQKDLILVMSPGCARKMSISQEIVDYLKGSPHALAFIRGTLPGEKVEYLLPAQLYGYQIVIEDTVKVTSRKGATAARSYVLGDTTPVMLSRVGGLESKVPVEAPSFSSLSIFAYEEMTVETKNDPDNRKTTGRVVEDYDVQLTAPVSSYLFTDAVAA